MWKSFLFTQRSRNIVVVFFFLILIKVQYSLILNSETTQLSLRWRLCWEINVLTFLQSDSSCECDVTECSRTSVLWVSLRIHKPSCECLFCPLNRSCPGLLCHEIILILKWRPLFIKSHSDVDTVTRPVTLCIIMIFCLLTCCTKASRLHRGVKPVLSPLCPSSPPRPSA